MMNMSSVAHIKAGVGEWCFLHFLTFKIGFLSCRLPTLLKPLFEETVIKQEWISRMFFIMNLNFMM